MEALVEGHDEVEVHRAVTVGARIIGVNSRDLRTFEVHPDIVQRLRPFAPPGTIFVAESGIASATDAARARAFGADAILVGEALMRAADPAAKARELTTASGGTISYLFKYAGRPFTKICGLVAPEQAQLAAECGADAIGLIFASQAPPHRSVTPDQATTVVRASKARSFPQPDPPFPGAEGGYGVRSPFATGVFVNEDPHHIAEIAARVGLDAIQLAGDETARQCAEVIGLTARPVLKSLRLHDEADLDQLDAYAMAGAVLLLDAHVPGSYGGSGVTGDWDLARLASQRWPVILSGGLTPENVAMAISTVQPRGVDVSSGVETNKVKDPKKIRAFVAAAKAATTSRKG
jgi:indole-3-glycerol phosphate synthase/phosphoribosylanthranilate isomerase/anthranilate synthase/indole-3-glycerol phosphate synthase/phosphoribosylanthranilate isomerase